MSKSKQIWPGPAMQRFFEATLAHETTLDGAERTQLAAALAKPIGRLLVYHDPADELATATVRASIGSTATAAEPDAAPATPDVTSGNASAPAVDPPADTCSPEPPANAAAKSEVEVDVADAAPPAPFDPFAFSVIAVFKRQGRDALMNRLAGIEQAEHLRRLADAQHLALDASADTAEALRLAIADGAAQRLADRRAAAS